LSAGEAFNVSFDITTAVQTLLFCGTGKDRWFRAVAGLPGSWRVKGC
jgi:hypothetical protein